MTDYSLENLTRQGLRWQGFDPANWVPPRDGIDHDVFIVGGGQTGVAIAYGLRRKGIARTSVIDSGQPRNGMWTRVARMNLLRTPKFVGGPEFSNPLLGFRAWYELQHGPEAFDALARAPRLDWAAYVEWFRETVKVPVRHGVSLRDIEPVDGGLRLHLDTDGVHSIETARKVVLATGLPGGGEPYVPDFIRALPRQFWSHTTDDIDFPALAGRSVGVIGLGPSALDAAGTALEAGAADVHLFGRRSQITYPAAPRPGAPPPGKFYPGAADNFFHLPDDLRWQHQLLLDEIGATTPLDSLQRATRFPNFHIHLDAHELDAMRVDGDGLTVPVPSGTVRLDHLVAATGYRVAVEARPELARFADQILLWGDRYDPSWGDYSPRAASYPYLGAGFEFLERTPGTAPFVPDIYCYNIAAAMSSGKYLCDVPSMTELPRLIAGISKALFFDDYAVHAARINSHHDDGHDPSPYAGSVRRAEAFA